MIDDPFDIKNWPIEKDDDTFYISLSNRVDCYCKIDRIDYEWAKQYLWCHTYGSGSINNETWTINRPDSIYARRSVPVGGFTESGRPRYGNDWLHLKILNRMRKRPAWAHCGDHIDGDSLNNKRNNLRWATYSMNARNIVGSKHREGLLKRLLVDKTASYCHDAIEISRISD